MAGEKDTAFRAWRLSLCYRIAQTQLWRRRSRLARSIARRHPLPKPKTPRRAAKSLQSKTSEERLPAYAARLDSFKGRARLQAQGVRRFLQTQKMHHDQQVLQNRGLVIAGVGNARQNLGNQLFLSDKLIRGLDQDRNQTAPPPPAGLVAFMSPTGPSSAVYVSFCRRHLVPSLEKANPLYVTDKSLAVAAESSVRIQAGTLPTQTPRNAHSPGGNAALRTIMQAATQMVRSVFAAKDVEMDLFHGHCRDDFTVDVLVDPSNGHVVACLEYLFMRK